MAPATYRLKATIKGASHCILVTDDEKPLDITDAAWLRDVLDQVEPLLIDRLAQGRADK